ncbi:hypothetical protein W822_09225 [Advenella kashmirensis W13003]|uniref:TauD/TfdA-like domain-containing protein n=1 Tax=Advenella kashmirensis W13003 TaxID=1424334 RepID=V8QU61_9BURK|nr:TauD/TfdA family dioxygenase [Advenella kashmirensis]ETF03486.1 hypothetical protein W822_09225 [Advenella kashmirensis W13003]
MDVISELKKNPNPRAAWTVADVTEDTSWINQLSPDIATELLSTVRNGRREEKSMLEYRKTDFPFSDAVLNALTTSFREVRDGRGMALIKGIPRENVRPDEFALITWAIGLHFGVARPQDRSTSYMNEVKNIGTDYRSPNGRGYSSHEQLDFHVDGADIVLLSCYNQAPVGGMSMCTSAVKALEVVAHERSELARTLLLPYPFSKNGQEAPGEASWINAPIYGFEEGRTFCAWNRNRVWNAQRLEGVPSLTALQSEAIGYLDAVIRRPDLMYCMHLERGDLQLLSNQTILHSRTSFQDDANESNKRTLYRLWLAMPDSFKLPKGWDLYTGSCEAGTVRGGNKGLNYDAHCLRFDTDQALAMGMSFQP